MKSGVSIGWIQANASKVLDALGISGSTSDPFRTISSFPATIDIGDMALLVTASGSLPMPTPTAGRKLSLRARGGDCTLTISGNHIENFSADLTNSLVMVDGRGVVFRGDGTNWIQFPG